MNGFKIDAIVNFSKWREEEIYQLNKLVWRGASIKDDLKKKTVQLFKFFELACTLAIVSGRHHTNDPTV